MSGPLAGASTPEVAMEFRIFSTEVAVSDEQLSHAFTKQLVAAVPGDQ